MKFEAASLKPIINQFISEDVSLIDHFQQGKRILTIGRNTGIARKAFLKASQGRYVLKEFPFYANDLVFAEEVTKYQRLLRERFGIPVPVHLPLKDDPEKFCVIVQDSSQSIFTVQEMVDGATANDAGKAMISAAKTLGNLHLASHTIGAEGTKYLLPKENIFANTVKLLERGKRELIASRYADHANAIEQLVDLYKTYVFQLAKQNGYRDTSLIVHGDYHINNSLFNSNDDVSAILDFDDAKYDNPVHDVARLANSVALFDFVEDPENPFNKVPDYVDKNKMNLILESYLDGFPQGAPPIRGHFTAAVKCLAVQVAFIGLLCGGYRHNQLSELQRFPKFLDQCVPQNWI